MKFRIKEQYKINGKQKMVEKTNRLKWRKGIKQRNLIDNIKPIL